MASLQSLNNISPTTSINNKSSHDASQNISIPSSSYFGAPQINYHLNKQQVGSQPYTSAASIFKTMEENISKNVLNMIGIQSNKNNMMVATICNVIDTVVSNFVDIFDDRFKFALNQMEIKINKKNQNWLNNINDINNKINGILIKIDKNDKINKSENEEKEEKQLIKILLNETNGIKLSIKEQSGITEKTFNKKLDEFENLIKSKMELHEINKNKMAEIINNKLKKIENNINIKLNQPPKVMINKLDEMNKEILNIKNKLNNNMEKIENMNKNMMNIKNECEASTFSNDVALQRMVKKSDNNNNNNNKPKKPSSIKDKKINCNYKNRKNNNKYKKNKNKNKNKKINNKNNKHKDDSALTKDIKITASSDNNNINKVETIWGQTFDPIITRNKELYGETNKNENAIEFYIECTTFDNEYGGCTEGNIVCINIKNNDNGDFKLYAIIKWHDELIKEYIIPDRGKDTTSTDVNWFVLDRKPEDDERDIHFLKLKGKPLDHNICLNKLYMGNNIIFK